MGLSLPCKSHQRCLRKGGKGCSSVAELLGEWGNWINNCTGVFGGVGGRGANFWTPRRRYPPELCAEVVLQAGPAFLHCVLRPNGLCGSSCFASLWFSKKLPFCCSLRRCSWRKIIEPFCKVWRFGLGGFLCYFVCCVVLGFFQLKHLNSHILDLKELWKCDGNWPVFLKICTFNLFPNMLV